MGEGAIFEQMKAKGIKDFCFDSIFFPGTVRKPENLLRAFEAYLGGFGSATVHNHNYDETELFAKTDRLKTKIRRLI